MSIKDELVALQREHGELLHVEVAVGWAKDNPESELHRSLEWNDTIAGHEYRLWQMRKLIQIHVVSEDGVREFVSLTIDRVRDGGYRDVNNVMQVPDLRDVMLQDALDELNRVRRRYQSVVALSRVWIEIDRVKEKKGGRKASVNVAKQA